MWGKTLKGARTKESQTLCSLYFSVVKNKLYLQPGGSGVCALCEGGAGGTFPRSSPLPRPPELGRKGNGLSRVRHLQPRTTRAPRSAEKFMMVTQG